MNKQPLSFGVVLVSFNTRQLLLDCLESCKAEADEAIHYIVVDNDSNDGSVEAVRSAFPDVTVIANSENSGFGAACNQGAKAADCDVLVMLNTDTLVLEGCWSALRSYFEQHADAGIVGGKVLNTDRTIQYSTRNFPTLPNLLSESLFLHHWLRSHRFFTEMICDDALYERDRSVDWVSGAFLACRRECWNALGGFDESYFMFGEDMDLCRRAQTRGYRVDYAAGPCVIHFGGGSSPEKTKILTMQMETRLFYLKRHHRAVAGAAACALVFFYLAVRSIAFRLHGLLPKRERSRAVARSYWEVFSTLRHRKAGKGS